MPDVLIRGIEEDSLRKVDEKARRRGLSRNEYLKREVFGLGAAADPYPRPRLTMADLERFSELTADMRSPDFEERAWS